MLKVIYDSVIELNYREGWLLKSTEKISGWSVLGTYQIVPEVHYSILVLRFAQVCRRHLMSIAAVTIVSLVFNYWSFDQKADKYFRLIDFSGDKAKSLECLFAILSTLPLVRVRDVVNKVWLQVIIYKVR